MSGRWCWALAAMFTLGCSVTSSERTSSTDSAESAAAEQDWSQFPEWGQCLAAIQGFYPAKFGVSVPIARNEQTGDCAAEGACHLWVDDWPDGNVWERIPNDGASRPSAYDLIVYPPTASNPWGHVASVDHVDTYGNVFVMDANYAYDERKAAMPHTVWRPASGWYHLRSLPKSGPPEQPSLGWCPNDALYCGGDYVQGDPNTLYRCTGHRMSVEQSCADGCEWMPIAVDDRCRASAPVSSWCPNNGLYCGGDWIQGDARTLYRCSAHALSVEEVCSNGCRWNPDGVNDACY